MDELKFLLLIVENVESNNASNWSIFFTTATPFLVAIIGGLVAHWLAVWRDRRNKRKEQRIQYLIEAYRNLSKAIHHPKLYEVADDFEQAIAIIQLFGSKKQIEMVQQFAQTFGEEQSASPDEILADLRRSLREELQMEKVEGNIWWVKVSRLEKDAQKQLQKKTKGKI